MNSPALSPFGAELASVRAALRTPWPTLLTLVAAGWAACHTGFHPAHTAVLALFGAQLALLAVVDVRTLTLPHLLTGMLALTGSVLAPLVLNVTFIASTMGSLLAFAGAFGCMALTDKLTGRASLGGGDVWLVSSLGFWLGAGGLPMFLLCAALTGTLSVIASRVLGRGRRPFPFGPALAAAGWLALLYQGAYWQTIQTLTS